MHFINLDFHDKIVRCFLSICGIIIISSKSFEFQRVPNTDTKYEQNENYNVDDYGMVGRTGA